MTNATEKIYDPLILDFILGIQPRECLAVDPPIQALLNTIDLEAQSFFGSNPSSSVMSKFYNKSRWKARRTRVTTRTIPIVLLSEINRDPHVLAGIERIYVYTWDEEQSATHLVKSTLEQARVKHCTVYSFKNEIHPIIASKMDVDRGIARLEAPEPTHKLFIMSPPRAGSFMLCEYLACLGAGHPDEHIRLPILKCLRERGKNDFDFIWWLRTLMKIAATDDGEWFGTKAISHFILRLLPLLSPKERDNFKGILDQSFVIFLRRDDKILQGISNFVAMATRTYRIPNKVQHLEYNRKTPVEYSFDKIRENVELVKEQDQQLNKLLNEYAAGFHEISYEALCQNPLGQIREVASYLQIPPPSEVSLSRNIQMRDERSLEMAAQFKTELHVRSKENSKTEKSG